MLVRLFADLPGCSFQKAPKNSHQQMAAAMELNVFSLKILRLAIVQNEDGPNLHDALLRSGFAAPGKAAHHCGGEPAE
jgi:hypothetical protein